MFSVTVSFSRSVHKSLLNTQHRWIITLKLLTTSFVSILIGKYILQLRMQDMFIYLHLSLPLNSINWLNDENQLCLPLIPPYPKYSQILSCGLGQKQDDIEQEDRNRCERRLQQTFKNLFQRKLKSIKGKHGCWAEWKRDNLQKGDFSCIIRTREGIFPELLSMLDLAHIHFQVKCHNPNFCLLINPIILYLSKPHCFLDSISKLRNQTGFQNLMETTITDCENTTYLAFTPNS